MVARRTYPDGSTLEGTWSYSYKITKTEVKCTSAGITLLDEWHYFLTAQRFLEGSTSTGADGTGYSLWSTGVEWRSQMVDTNGTTVLSETQQDWARRAAISWTTGYSTEQVANDNRVSETRKYLDDGSMSKTDTFYDSLIAASNHINNPSAVYEYDFDGALKRYTTTTYLTGGNYTGTGVNTVNLLSLPLQQSVYDGGGVELARTNYEYDNYDGTDQNHAALQSYSPDAYNHDSGFGSGYTTRGNTTQITRMINSSTFTYTYPRYDTLGNLVSTKDPHTYVTTISYLDDFGNGAAPGFGSVGSFGPTYSLPTMITSPPPNPGEPAHTALSQYDFSTGLLTGFKDRNGVVTQTLYNDSFDRPTQIMAALATPAENHTAMYYAPAFVFGVSLTNNDVLTAKDQTGLDDSALRSWTKTDGFGRTTDAFTRDPQGDVRVTTNYDGLGRVKRVTNPYRSTSDPTYGYTETTYDMIGRVRFATTYDGTGNSTGTITTDYLGNQVTVTDQAGKVRRSVTDGLGRLKQIIEDPLGLSYSTSYSYDGLDDLTGVTQGGQPRTFTYDGLKRLTQANNPESGTVNYNLYDGNNNLLQKTDARGIITTYTYDALNRVKTRTYTNDPQNTPQVTYSYDAAGVLYSKGRLTQVSSNVSTSDYLEYDQLGRIKQTRQTTSGGAAQGYTTGYGYNLAGAMITETYPSGRVITTGFDTAGRINQISGQKTGEPNRTYSSQFSYTAHGAVAAMQLGNGKWEHTSFNNRLQPTLIGLGTSNTDSSILKLEYEYGGTTNNGNVLTQKITVPGLSLNQCYGYDSLNRLSTAEERSGTVSCSGTQQWKQAFSYDRFGNRNFDVANTTSNVLGPNPTINQTDNRIAPNQNYGYDFAGNLTSDPTTPLDGIRYDAENRQTQYTKTSQATNFYYYDGDGRRVKKVDSSGTSVFVYNAEGQLIAEYHSDPVPPAAGGGGTSYLTSDHLGSTRVVTTADGAVKARYDYLPFGEELGSGIGSRTIGMGYSAADSTKQKFTQKERDNESGLDYFGARYYSSAQGRFTSVDPNPVTKENFVNPQRWNLYIYVNNNPLAAVDPNGGDGEGKGGDKVISVFLVMTNKERNTMTSDGKTSVVGAPNWNGTRDIAGRNGYDLQVFGSADVAGKGASPATPEGFEGALKSSEVVVYVDHGVGDTNNVPFVPTFIEVGDKGYSAGGAGKVVQQPGNNILSLSADKPQASASVICNFSCNSSANSGFFDNKGKGQIMVTVNSGKDGLTTVGTLERAANAFIRTYVQTKGSTEDRVKAGVRAANNVIYQDRNRRTNRGDKVEEQRVN